MAAKSDKDKRDTSRKSPAPDKKSSDKPSSKPKKKPDDADDDDFDDDAPLKFNK